MSDERDPQQPFPANELPAYQIPQRGWVAGLLIGSMALALMFGLIMIEHPGPVPLAGMVVCGMAFLFGLFAISQNTIESLLERRLGSSRAGKLHTLSKNFPAYRYADIVIAVSALAARTAETLRVESQHDLTLAVMLGGGGGAMAGNARRLKRPTRVPVEIDYKEERYVPADQLWIMGPDAPFGLAVLRVRQLYHGDVALELAADETRGAEEAIEEIVKLSGQLSVYRNKLLTVRFDGGSIGEWGEIEAGREVLGFIQERPVTREDLVLPERTWQLLDRVVFDAFAKRERLVELGVPAKRGLLFHGPPGTGKTYTCRYIYSNLKDVTTLVVTGQSLGHVKSVCNLARMLQPSLVVLEDVDLAFASREINLYSSALGELMDELDGFARDDAVTFLLTTNAIERLEKAISDRPGRVSQCIFFGPPTEDLRLRYLECYLRDYDTSLLTLHPIVRRTDGASQAFLRELINRAIQVCLDDPVRGVELQLDAEDFHTALDEMTDGDAAAGGAIVGFAPAKRDIIRS